MKMVTIVVALYLGTCSLAINGNSISGTGGSPGPNTSNALNRGTTGNNLGRPPINGAGPAASRQRR